MAPSKGSTSSTAGRTRQTKKAAETKKTTAARGKSGAKRKYPPEASEFVEEEMKEMKQGKLKSGRSGKVVRNPKQAVAIGLSEARKSGVKVPQKPRRKAA